MKKWMTVICAIFLFSAAVITVNAEDAGEPVGLAESIVTVGDFTISGDDLSESDYRYENNVLTILSSKPITISTPNNDADHPTTTDRIVVDSLSGANITLSDVNIDRSSITLFSDNAAFGIEKEKEGEVRGSVTITLVGDNTLMSGTTKSGFSDYGCAGLQNNCIPVTITGSGNLTAKGGYGSNGSGGAGIGGSGYYENKKDGKNITISGSGTVTAIGNDGAAGIGGAGWQSIGDSITINGSGTVIAEGGTNGSAGIGGGNGGNGNNITISMSDSGTVTAIGDRSGGAGIGGGRGGNGTNITINGGGTVIAEATSGAGIGGGETMHQSWPTDEYIGGNGTGIIISGSVNVTASAGQHGSDTGFGSFGGAGIGGGKGGSGTDITISSSGKVEAIGGKSGGAGIGGGNGGSGDKIKIEGSGTVIATGGSWPDNGYFEGNSAGAGIGGGNGGNGTNITISSSGIVTATGGSHYHYSDNDTYSAAGIGGGNGGNGEGINISGGTVTATGGECGGAGIGGGKGGTGGTAENPITISGGTVTATAGSHSDSVGGGAGIGSGNGSSGGSNIMISGGQVTATSDIGPGIGGESSTVTIDVNIQGTSETSYPWVVTNKIESTNDADAYRGIIFDKAHNDGYSDDAPVGVVYGTVTLTQPYTVEAGATLRVHSGATLKTNNNLTLAGTLYLEAGAKLDKYNKLTITGAGQIKHEDPSKKFYVEVSPGKWICDICGKEEPHNWEKDWQENDTHHWHKCTGANDCSVNEVAFSCSITDYSTVTDSGYGEHDYDFDKPTVKGRQLYYYCKVCNHEYIVDIPTIYLTKEDGKNAPLAGAEFGLYSDEECTEANRIAVGTTAINADNKAVVSFDIEQLSKTYYIKEIKAPDGYRKSDDVFKAVVGANGKVTYGTVGSETTLETVLICKNDKIIPDPVQIIKLDDEGKALTGAKFKLYSNAGCTAQVGNEVIATEMRVDGKTKAVASFTEGIELGKTYYIKETKAPDGYKVSGEVYKAVVDKDGKVTYSVIGPEGNVTVPNGIPECVNTKIIPDPVQIIKLDNEGKALTGAKFKLYSDENCTETKQVGAEVTAAEKTIDGKTKAVASFTEGIELGKTYYIKETKAPDGYTVSDKVYKAVVGADGKVTYSVVGSEGNVTVPNGIPECVNTKIIPDPVQIIKVDGEGKALTGAKFKLYSDKNCTETKQVGAEVTAVEKTIDGETKAVASFTEGIELGKTYYIKETKAPDGYTASDKVYKAVVDKDGKVTYGDVDSEETAKTVPVYKNYKIIPDAAKIIKVDGETGAPLAGAEFGIYSDKECTDANRIAVGTTAIDNDRASDTYNKAVVSFTTELNRTYYIKEIKAPNGYEVSGVVYKAVVNAEGKVTYGAAGSETTSETVLKCKNYKIISDNAKVIKEDGETGDPLVGAEFGIYSDEDCTDANRIDVGITAIDTDSASDTYNKAVVSFATEPNRTYYIKEIKAPDGYKASEDVFKAVVGADGKVTYGVVGSETTSETAFICKNDKIIPDPAKIIKLDGESGAPLAGAEFGIYSDEACTEANRIAVGTTAIDTDSASDTYNRAVVSFTTELNRTYYIKEIKAPYDYNISSVVYKAVVDANGKVTYSVAGSETTLETVPICKNYAVKITYNPPSITKVEETGDPIVLSPKTGDAGEVGAAGIAILSGIACAAFLVEMVQKRQRKKQR